MPLPPMYFSVYQLHFRLPEPGLHAQPLLQSPPVPHLEGIHTIQWLFSKTDKLSSTVKGDFLKFALKNHDSAKFIPHVPIPLCAGPFLIDTLNNSQYVVLFAQANVLLDKQEVGIFFWLIASPWRCMEIKLPMPPFMKRLGAAGVARRRAQSAQKAAAAISKAKEEIEKLEEAKEAADEMTPEEYSEADEKFDYDKGEAKIEAAKKKITDTEEKQKKDEAKLQDAEKYASDVDSEAGKPAKGEKPEDAAQRVWEAEHEAKAEDHSEREALKEKSAADAEARQANAAADAHDAEAKSNYKKAAGASGGGGAENLDAAAEHEAKSSEQRAKAKTAEEKSKAADAKAKEHRKSARESRKKKSQKDHRQQSAKEYREKQPGKDNPYTAAGAGGNVAILFPSLLAHVPFPCTVFIYKGWLDQLKSFGLAMLSSAISIVKGCLGFIFDSLGAGRGVVGQAAASLAKGVANSLADAAKTYIAEGKVEFKLSTKVGPVTVSAELSQGKDGNWSWKASGKAEVGKGSAEVSHEEKVSSTTKDGKTSKTESSSNSAKVKFGKAEGSVSGSDSTKTTTDASGKTTTETSDSTSVSGKVGPVEGSQTKEHTETTSEEGGKKTTETSDSTTRGGKVSGEAKGQEGELGFERKTTTTKSESGESTEVTDTGSGKLGPAEGSASKSHKEESSAADGVNTKTTTDSTSGSGKLGPAEGSASSSTKVENSTSDTKDVETRTQSSSRSGRAGPLEGDTSKETSTSTTSEGSNVTTETKSTSSSHSTGAPDQTSTSTTASTAANPPPPVDYSHGAPSLP